MSRLEQDLALQLKAAKLPEAEREYQALASRRYRLDFAWPRATPPLGVECEGGLWRDRRTGRRGAGHTSTPQILRDMEKSNLLQLAGWRVLRVSEPHIRSGQALAWIEQALKAPQIPEDAS